MKPRHHTRPGRATNYAHETGHGRRLRRRSGPCFASVEPYGRADSRAGVAGGANAGGRQLGRAARCPHSIARTDADQQALIGSIAQLDEFFLLVIVGEFNAGKSAFINALIGQRAVQEGVTPTTAEIQLLKYGETATSHLTDRGLRVITAPADLLRDVHIVDTPGTNAIIREHEELTRGSSPGRTLCCS